MNDLNAELAVLSGIMADNNALDRVRLATDDFLDRRNGLIFDAMRKIRDAGNTIDFLTLFDELKDAVPASYISTLNPVSAANIEYWERKTAAESRRRKLMALMHEVAGNIHNEEVIAKIETELTQITPAETVHLGMKEMMHATLDAMQTAYNNRMQSPYIMTGWRKLDDWTGGFKPGQLVVIAARPSVGKSALAVNWFSEMMCAGVHAGFISIEMSLEQLGMRMMASRARVCSSALRTGMISKEGFDRVVTAASELSKHTSTFVDAPSPTLGRIHSMLRRLARDGCRIVFIDYLTLVAHDDKNLPRHERVGLICKALKAAAKALAMTIVVLSQLRRDAEDKVPGLSDLRQSGEIEEDADIVILLHRPRSADVAQSERDNTTLLIMAKNREGPTDTMRLRFSPEYVCFEPEEATHAT